MKLFSTTGFLLLSVFVAAELVAQETSPIRSRQFEFTYSGSLTDVPPNASVRMWLPTPPNTDDQDVELKTSELPGEAVAKTEARFGNRFYFVEFQHAGTSADDSDSVGSFSLQYDVTRRSRHGLSSEAVSTSEEAEQARQFLGANRMVPLVGKQQRLLNGLQPGVSAVETTRGLYETVYEHLDYDKSNPGYGNGDVLWACDSRTGNCTDFHSVFISLSRIRRIPAKFQIGFPLPAERGAGKIGGYHCWAQFHDAEKGWVPVDISEADKHPDKKDFFFGNLDENRIEFTTGRDIVLEPKQSGEPLNYFVYPHVEVNGQVWPKEKIALSFSYKDK